ncbi:MAG TPA: hypothetical protein PKY13_05640 [Microthrixaceae bacterium]|jgi:hypothetical protein|nr:hypothetical protein [Microthrixaceae bacterium]HQF93490.1 hypothetical protein [Microthrixaceae bacterium]
MNKTTGVRRLTALVAITAILVATSSCVNRQGWFAAFGDTRACYGVALETRTTKLDGGAASWYSAQNTCNYASQLQLATFVQVSVTIQAWIANPGIWANCTLTKTVANNTGTITFDFNETWGGDQFNGGVCGGGPFSGDPQAGVLFATNAGHVVKVNGTNQFTNQAVTEVAS